MPMTTREAAIFARIEDEKKTADESLKMAADNKNYSAANALMVRYDDLIRKW
jgi:hypothetical protein